MSTTFTRLFCAAFFGLILSQSLSAQHFEATATLGPNNTIVFAIKPVGGSITTGWSDIEFFLRNLTSNGVPNFAGATIVVNTAQFPNVSIPFNGMNIQGAEVGYNNYWFGVSFAATAANPYTNGVSYTVCTIFLASSPSSYGLELVHNEGFVPTYLALTDQGGNDKSSPSGNKFYGPGATICSCPVSNPSLNHVLPLNGALPLELLDFQAHKLNQQDARLQWETALELNVDKFEIQRETEGRWETIGFEDAKAVEGRGYSYTYTDYAVAGRQVYYRLRIIDRDASFSFSPIRNVLFERHASVSLFPNPASELLHLQFGETMPEEELQVELVDALGRVIFQKRITAGPGLSQMLDLADYQLSTGMYLLRAASENGFKFSENVVIEEAH